MENSAIFQNPFVKLLPLAALIIAVLAVAPAASHAGTLSDGGDDLTYRSSAGENNRLELEAKRIGADFAVLDVRDDQGIDGSLPFRCHFTVPGDRTQATCDVAELLEFRVFTQDGDDHVQLTSQDEGTGPRHFVPADLYIDGGSGSDAISTWQTEMDFNRFLVGGEGNDRIITANALADTLSCGDGADVVRADLDLDTVDSDCEFRFVNPRL